MESLLPSQSWQDWGNVRVGMGRLGGRAYKGGGGDILGVFNVRGVGGVILGEGTLSQVSLSAET